MTPGLRTAAGRLAGLVLAVAVTAATGGPARLSAQDAQAPQQPTFRARIDSVSVDVIVLDQRGRPVTDLTAEDFEIREDGRPQTIDTFKFIDIAASAAARPTTRRDIVSFEDQRREAARDDTRVLVIFLDDYHVRLGNSMRVREQLAAFVSRMDPNDLVAVAYPLTPVTGLTFSRNHDGTAAAIMNFVGRKYDYTPRNAYEERFQMQPPEALERMRNEITIAALEAVCGFLGSLREGRKTVLFVSEGLSGTLPSGVNTRGTLRPNNTLPVDDRMAFFNATEVMRQLRHVFVTAGRANTSVYTLDPRGLTTSEFSIEDNVSSDADRRALNEAMDTLRSIAAETDGRAIVNRNNPAPELQQMLQDTGAYYLLGYTSSPAPRDGKFHEIQVRVRRPDVEVRARKGYWAYTAEEVERAMAPPKPEPPPDVLEALNTLAAIADPSSYRLVHFWVGSTRREGGDADVTLAWEAIARRPAPDAADEVQQVTVAARSAANGEVFNGPVPRADGVGAASGRVTFTAPPGPLQVRVSVENARGVRLDSEDRLIEVPDFETGALVITAPAVFRGRTAYDIQTLRAAAEPVPTVTRTFSRTERLLVRFGVHGGDGTPTVTMQLLNRAGDSMADLPPPKPIVGGRYEADLGLGGLPPGEYLIDITARTGAESTRTLLAIRVTG